MKRRKRGGIGRRENKKEGERRNRENEKEE